jgi:hypothetical protein
MPPIVSKLKGREMFSVILYMLRQTLCRLASPCPFYRPFPSYCDVSQARIYFASTCTYAQFKIYILAFLTCHGLVSSPLVSKPGHYQSQTCHQEQVKITVIIIIISLTAKLNFASHEFPNKFPLDSPTGQCNLIYT